MEETKKIKWTKHCNFTIAGTYLSKTNVTDPKNDVLKYTDWNFVTKFSE